MVIVKRDALVEGNLLLPPELLVLQSFFHHSSELAELGFHVHHPRFSFLGISRARVIPTALWDGAESSRGWDAPAQNGGRLLMLLLLLLML